MSNLTRNLDVLIKIINMINKPIKYVLSGSTSLKLQGVDVIPRDIDIFTDKEGVDYFYSILLNYIIIKPEILDTDIATSYYSKYIIDGVEIEIISDIKNKKNNLIDKYNYIVYKEYKNVNIPVMSLEKELESYKRLNRKEKVEKIEDVLNKI